jgi:hypothetical protein|nr:MAG TPA: hypothetical protein [Caudoviricetes sp.]
MASRKITDLMFNGRQLISAANINRILFNGKVIWPPQTNLPTVQRVVFNGEVLYDRSAETPYLEIEKLLVILDQDNNWFGQNKVLTNTTFKVE